MKQTKQQPCADHLVTQVKVNGGGGRCEKNIRCCDSGWACRGVGVTFWEFGFGWQFRPRRRMRPTWFEGASPVKAKKFSF